jgi:type I restriction enzyme R subunit
MEPDRLFESPFKDLHAQGPLGLFPPAKVTRIVEVLNTFKERAAA